MNRPAEFDKAVLGLMANLRGNAMALTRNPDKAADLVQDTIEKALRYHAHYTPGTNLIGWLFTIMRNEHFTRFRKDARLVGDPDGIYAATLEVPAEQEPRVELQDVMRCLDRGPAIYRDALLMTVDGHSYEDAAAAFGCEVGTIRSRVNRARKHLAEMVA